MADSYNPDSDIGPTYLDVVREWIDHRGEVLVVLRYLRMAGAKDFALCRLFAEFETIVNRVPDGTDIEVFRDRQLPMRSIVDAEFIEAATRSIPEGTEYLLLTGATKDGCRIARLSTFGMRHAELREDLNDLLGEEVFLGPCPDYTAADHEGLISASKGGINGPR